MSYLGAIRFKLKQKEGRVTDVRVEPLKELKVERLLQGHTVEEALAILPPLFALCPDSQTAAANIACRIASGEEFTQTEFAHARFLNHLEIINEGVRFFALQCASDLYRQNKIKAVCELRETVRKLKALPASDTEGRKVLWSELRALVSLLLLDGFSDHWEQDLFNGTFDGASDSLTGFFHEAALDRTLGFCTAPMIPAQSSDHALDLIVQAGAYKKQPWDPKVPFLTGPVERMRHHPTVQGLLVQDGNTTYTRLVARFIEVLSSADVIRVPHETVSAQKLGEGTAVALLQNSRGILLHAVHVDGSRESLHISEYSILTPTEINVVQSEWFKKTLLSVKAASKEALKEKVYRTILSFDPCTQIDLEIEDA